MEASEIQISKKGCAVAFTASGKTICACFNRKRGSWQVWIDSESATTIRSFNELLDAQIHAASLADDEATRRLKWWN